MFLLQRIVYHGRFFYAQVKLVKYRAAALPEREDPRTSLSQPPQAAQGALESPG